MPGSAAGGRLIRDSHYDQYGNPGGAKTDTRRFLASTRWAISATRR
jgi:hypothetical protein